MSFAKLLEIQFQGFFLCRLATDPDPTNEERGVSGYTMSLLDEDPLDQVIRTQITPEYAARNLLNPADPHQKIWQIEDPSTYQTRLPTNFTSGSTQASAAIRVFDIYGYFRDRRRWLSERIDALRKDLAEGKGDPAAIEAKIQGLTTRIYQIEFWGDRFATKLQFQLTYAFNINGPQSFEGQEHLGGEVDTSHPWPVTFWLGGWDGDLLTGFMQGALSVPFRKT